MPDAASNPAPNDALPALPVVQVEGRPPRPQHASTARTVAVLTEVAARLRGEVDLGAEQVAPSLVVARTQEALTLELLAAALPHLTADGLRYDWLRRALVAAQQPLDAETAAALVAAGRIPRALAAHPAGLFVAPFSLVNVGRAAPAHLDFLLDAQIAAGQGGSVYVQLTACGCAACTAERTATPAAAPPAAGGA